METMTMKYFSFEETADLLRVTGEELDRLTGNHSVLGVRVTGPKVVYPAWQFDKDDRPPKDLRIIFGLYADAFSSTDAIDSMELEFALWLLGPFSESMFESGEDVRSRVQVLHDDPELGLLVAQRMHSKIVNKDLS